MLGDDLIQGLNNEINKTIRQYKMSIITQQQALKKLDNLNLLIQNPLFNGKKKKIKQEILKIKRFINN